METPRADIRVLKGDSDILLVAPHGLSEDDENTDRVARQAAERLACTAIINTGLPRRQLDLNRIHDAERHPVFVKILTTALNRGGCTRVIWIHGMKDKTAAKEARFLATGEGIDCLIGYGLPDRLTARTETVAQLAVLLNAAGLKTAVAADRRSKFRGYAADNMNQWFRINHYPLAKVESIQLEMSWSGVREEGYIAATAAMLGSALKRLINTKG